MNHPENYFRMIYCVVVVYNKSISKSITIRNLSQINREDIVVVVVDNSTKDFGNKESCQILGNHYIDMCGNRGLSKAYNTSLNFIMSFAKMEDVVVWFDDDTDISEDYFTHLNEAILSNSFDVFVPLIRGQDGIIYSPNNNCFLKNRLVKSINEINFKKINAINSCLAVRFRLFVDYRYDEELFLDSIDQNFFDDLRVMGVNFKILDIVINQEFSQRANILDKTLIVPRLRIRVKDLMVYARKSWLYTFLGVIKAFGWGVVFSYKCKSAIPLLVCVDLSIAGFCKNTSSFLYREDRIGKNKNINE